MTAKLSLKEDTMDAVLTRLAFTRAVLQQAQSNPTDVKQLDAAEMECRAMRRELRDMYAATPEGSVPSDEDIIALWNEVWVVTVPWLDYMPGIGLHWIKRAPGVGPLSNNGQLLLLELTHRTKLISSMRSNKNWSRNVNAEPERTFKARRRKFEQVADVLGAFRDVLAGWRLAKWCDYWRDRLDTMDAKRPELYAATVAAQAKHTWALTRLTLAGEHPLPQDFHPRTRRTDLQNEEVIADNDRYDTAKRLHLHDREAQEIREALLPATGRSAADMASQSRRAIVSTLNLIEGL